MKHWVVTQKKILKILIIALLSVFGLIALIWFVTSARQIYKAGELQPDSLLTPSPHHTHRTVAITVESIKPWMTFNYLTVVFKLPPLYLKDTLAITDPRYPNIRIDSYTKSRQLDPAFFMQNLQKAITSYSYTK